MAHGSATSSWASCTARTVGAPVGGGSPAIGAKKPLTTAVRSPASGMSSVRAGPPSRLTVASQKAKSTRGLPRLAQFQSTSFAPLIDDADVVATHVEVDEGLAADVAAIGRSDQLRQRSLEPLRGTETETQERRRVVSDLAPCVEVAPHEPLQTIRWRQRMDLRQRRSHELHIPWTPGRRPVDAGQVLQHQDRAHAVVVPAHEPRHEGALDTRVDPLLVAEKPGCRLVDGDLRERARSVGQLDEPVLHQRVAAAEDPAHRLRAEPRG